MLPCEEHAKSDEQVPQDFGVGGQDISHEYIPKLSISRLSYTAYTDSAQDQQKPFAPIAGDARGEDEG